MTKYEKKKLDSLWQKLITVGKCSYPGCNKTGSEGHHIFKRRFYNTRWKVENGRALCRTHHDWAETHPVIYEALIIGEIGLEAYGVLRLESLTLKKQYYNEILEYLKGRL